MTDMNAPEIVQKSMKELITLNNPNGTIKGKNKKLTDAEKAMNRVEEPKEYRPNVRHRPNILRLKGSVLPSVIIPTIMVTIFAAIITILFEVYAFKLSIPNTFTPIIGIVVGLLLSYRTNTAYDRFWEGRKLWSTMVVHIRNLTRNIWVGVREDKIIIEKEKVSPKVGKSQPEIILEKATAINLLLGFAVAVKHFLREETGTNHADLEYLISNIGGTLKSFKPLAAKDVNTSNARKVGWFTKIFQRKLKPHQRKFNPSSLECNLPLEITLYLSSYIKTQLDTKRIENPLNNQLYMSLNELKTILSHEPPRVDDWINADENHPFPKDKDLTASDAAKKPKQEIRTLLAIEEVKEVAGTDGE
ncbi:10994_t:CDS:2 [Funneliformis caledonium]|uniref:10994_t:CDS:1 n=1 Tax=Funneliformis caledonium TaxID=1117310 RepID=A0A9N9EK15_9GLOM|nr:10994_t:CDS:2 [Funneliformis caledonium]